MPAAGAASFAAAGLPDGLTLDPTTGSISGSPTAAGTFAVTLTATNAFGAGTASLVLPIDPLTQEAGVFALGERMWP